MFNAWNPTLISWGVLGEFNYLFRKATQTQSSCDWRTSAFFFQARSRSMWRASYPTAPWRKSLSIIAMTIRRYSLTLLFYRCVHSKWRFVKPVPRILSSLKQSIDPCSITVRFWNGQVFLAWVDLYFGIFSCSPKHQFLVLQNSSDIPTSFRYLDIPHSYYPTLVRIIPLCL